MLLAGTLLSPDATAAVVDTAGATTCDLAGFSIDSDPKGANIRAAPLVTAPVIGHLLPPQDLEPGNHSGEQVTQEFHIAGSKDGWLLIADVQPAMDRHGKPYGAFAGPGWVSGKLVGLELGAWTIRAAPNHDAPILAWMIGENWGADSAKVMAVHGCQDKYADVTAAAPNGKPVRGWSWHPCASQLTTCDRADAELDAEPIVDTDKARSECTPALVKPDQTCHVGTFDRIGTVAGRDFFYARYDVTPASRIVVFVRLVGVALHPVLTTADDAALAYGKPEITRALGRAVLRIPVTEAVGGAARPDLLYEWTGGAWRAAPPVVR